MPTSLHQRITRNPASAARMAAWTRAGMRFGEALAPVAIAQRRRMDAPHAIEKDGTGIGTGFDKGRRPELGAWSGLAQDVSMEHGRSRTLPCGMHQNLSSPACGLA